MTVVASRNDRPRFATRELASQHQFFGESLDCAPVDIGVKQESYLDRQTIEVGFYLLH